MDFMGDMGVSQKKFEAALTHGGVIVFNANYDVGSVAAVGED